VRCLVLIFVGSFLFSLGGSAADWVSVKTDHLVVFAHNPELAATVSVSAEEIFQRVLDYWLPMATLGAEAEDILFSEEDEEQLGYVGPNAALFVFSDREAFWDATGCYGYAGGTFSMLGLYSPHTLRHSTAAKILDLLLGEMGIVPLMGVSLCLCPGGDCFSVLAHEFTHMLQFGTISIPEGWFPSKEVRTLLLEGMAVWTQYALGYSREFELRVSQPVARWLHEGGELGTVSPSMAYLVGASLVELLSQTLPPSTIFALLSPDVAETLGLPRENSFVEEFRKLSGEGWDSFLIRWRDHYLRVEVSPRGEALYHAYLLNLRLRAAFLWPLFTDAEREELALLLTEGPVDQASVDRIEEILWSASASPAPEVMEALHMRLEPLRREIKEILGPEAALEVVRLSTEWARGGCEPEGCVRAFVELVNRYLIPHGSGADDPCCRREESPVAYGVSELV